MKYPIILLDADDTLLDFGTTEAAALSDTLQAFHLPNTPEIRAVYSRINVEHWKLLEQGKLTRAELKLSRFRQFLESIGADAAIDPAAVNAFYMERLGGYAIELPGAADLCRKLAEHHRLYIVTNGSACVQHRRMAATALLPYIEKVYISEEIGAQKPSKTYFDAVFADLGNPPLDEIIILGDSQTSDMLGGKQAGITTCWFNPAGKEATGEWDFTIRSLEEFLSIVEE